MSRSFPLTSPVWALFPYLMDAWGTSSAGVPSSSLETFSQPSAAWLAHLVEHQHPDRLQCTNWRRVRHATDCLVLPWRGPAFKRQSMTCIRISIVPRAINISRQVQKKYYWKDQVLRVICSRTIRNLHYPVSQISQFWLLQVRNLECFSIWTTWGGINSQFTFISIDTAMLQSLWGRTSRVLRRGSL